MSRKPSRPFVLLGTDFTVRGAAQRTAAGAFEASDPLRLQQDEEREPAVYLRVLAAHPCT